jgi:hypothetical protein
MSGCGDTSKPSDIPPLYPCTVTVTQEGVPLAEAMVEFISAEQTKYRAVALTGGNGTVQMSTYGHSGVPIGKYKVVVTKKADDDFVYKKNSAGENEPVSWNTYKMVEDKYSDAETTPHEIEITGKGRKVEATFDVGKAVKVKH